MSKREPSRIQLTDSQNSDEHTPLNRGFELEKRYTPLVVIAIIAILIGLYIP